MSLKRHNGIHLSVAVALVRAWSRFARRVRESSTKHEGRLVVHDLPASALPTHPIERVCGHLHDEVTRNHRCGRRDELLGLVRNWLAAGSTFPIATDVYAD